MTKVLDAQGAGNGSRKLLLTGLWLALLVFSPGAPLVSEGSSSSVLTNGSISGGVYRSDGVTPVAGADVWANDYDGGPGNGYARTAAEGTYAMTGLPAGDYRVESSAAELGYGREFYRETSEYQLATHVAVVPGATTPGVDFTLDSGGSISGAIYRSLYTGRMRSRPLPVPTFGPTITMEVRATGMHVPPPT